MWIIQETTAHTHQTHNHTSLWPITTKVNKWLRGALDGNQTNYGEYTQ